MAVSNKDKIKITVIIESERKPNQTMSSKISKDTQMYSQFDSEQEVVHFE